MEIECQRADANLQDWHPFIATDDDTETTSDPSRKDSPTGEPKGGLAVDPGDPDEVPETTEHGES